MRSLEATNTAACEAEDPKSRPTVVVGKNPAAKIGGDTSGGAEIRGVVEGVEFFGNTLGPFFLYRKRQ